MRKALTLFVVVGLAASLSACAGSSNAPISTSSAASTSAAAATDGPCTPIASGKATDAVKVTGALGAKPTATFATPLTTDATERSVLVAGTGAAVKTGDRVQVDLDVINATSGAEITSTNFDSKTYQSFTVGTATLLPGLSKTLSCATIGSRILSVVPPADAWGTSGQAQLGVAGTDSVIFILDVVSVVKPTVAEKYADMKDMPTVAFAADNNPTITIPKIDPPTVTRLGIMKEGTGAVVTPGQTVSVNYRGVIWATGTEFDSSWKRNAPSSFATNEVIPGFTAALEGQKIGSTVIVVIPPADGYGAAGSGTIKGTDTIVFVIDILSAS